MSAVWIPTSRSTYSCHAISWEHLCLASKNFPTKWCNRTHRAVFTWQEPPRKEGTVSYEDRKSTWNSGVRKATRRGSAEDCVCKHRDRVRGAWKQISKQRRLVDVSYDPSMVTAIWHGTWMDEESFKKTCIKEKGKREGISEENCFSESLAPN